MLWSLSSPSVRADFLIVADGAQVAEGKLYVMGGAWNRVSVQAFPATIPFAVALGILVAWDETNVARHAALTVEDEDGSLLIGPLDIRLEVGRPAGAIPGEDQRVVVAVNGQLGIPGPGGFSVVVRLDDEELARTSFRALST
jgi:hypothetical protein